MIGGISQKNFKVMIRVRPLVPKEKQQISSYEQSHTKRMKSSSGRNSIKLSPAAYSFYAKYYNFPINQVFNISKQDNTIYLADPEYKSIDRRMRGYTYSNVYSWQDNNMTIFNQNLKEDVSKVLQGFNCTILAYGITGSGKTYTVFGKQTNLSGSITNPINTKTCTQKTNIGISYKSFEYLLSQKQKLVKKEGNNIKKLEFKFSFIEIYNQNVRDLLSNDNNRFLNIVEDGKGNTSVSDVTEVSIQNIQEINSYINLGTSKRAFASTNSNQYSSRSHAILQLQVQIQRISNHQKTTAKLFIIDLAGSEKIQSLNCSKKMQQGANINKSLLALGNCITTLSQNSRKNIISHIPYRDSKLTRMLKDSLGGNTKTIMIACISPNPFLIEQTTTTLNYALRAQGINKKLIRNCLQEQNQQQQFICKICKNKSQKIIQPIINQNIKGQISSQILQSIYQDIVENAQEGQKIKIALENNPNSEDLQKLQIVNKKQKQQLKCILNTFVSYKFPKRSQNSKLSNMDQKQNNKIQIKCITTENDCQNNKDQKISLSGSKSRRRRSHNKFEVARRPQTEAF